MTKRRVIVHPDVWEDVAGDPELKAALEEALKTFQDVAESLPEGATDEQFADALGKVPGFTRPEPLDPDELTAEEQAEHLRRMQLKVRRMQLKVQ